MFYFIYFALFFIYEECLYKYLLNLSFDISLINLIIYLLFLSLIISLLLRLLFKPIGNILTCLLSLLLSIYYAASILIKKVFGITLSYSVLSLYKNITDSAFMSETINTIITNFLIILLVFIPFFLSLILIRFNKTEFKLKKISFNILLIFVMYLSFLISINFNDDLFNLYFKKHNNGKNIQNFGVVPSLVMDIRKSLCNFEEIIDDNISLPLDEEDKINEIEYLPRTLVLNYPDTDNSTINNMNNYFQNESFTYTNEYTGIFKDKNLIYIMAESFDGYFVSEELTPTLYKMIHSGFDFTNYYSPTNLSTIGGEFSLLTGLLPDLQCLNWQWIQDNDGYINTFPYGLANLFKERNYNTYAYHNYDYSFQSRYKYLSSLGFDNFEACFNGLEEKIACNIFPASDDEMIKATIDDYINDERFMVYYATVSGHGNWNFVDNDMSIQNKDLVENLDYNENVKAYIAANLELEKAMTSLIEILSENGRLEDTVIVLAADHHPYFLSDEDMENLAQKDLDKFSLYKSNLIIYNPEIEHTIIDKPCNTIDVLPTTLNLFDFDYDSRIIIGKDILDSRNEGLVIFADYSWLNKKGKYDSETSYFSGEISEDYISYYNNLVYNRYLMSRNILIKDYYKLVLN